MHEASMEAVQAWAKHAGRGDLPLMDAQGDTDQLTEYVAAARSADDPKAFMAYWEGEVGNAV